jgi:hypothetical protein
MKKVALEAGITIKTPNIKTLESYLEVVIKHSNEILETSEKRKITIDTFKNHLYEILSDPKASTD